MTRIAAHLTFILSVVASSGATAQSNPHDHRGQSTVRNCVPGLNQVAFFQHAKYKGACVVRKVGRYANAKSIGIGNDKISSVKIGSGTQVVLCKDNNFKGTCKTYAKSMSSIGKMNDKTDYISKTS